jgi:hypothetical protein
MLICCNKGCSHIKEVDVFADPQNSFTTRRTNSVESTKLYPFILLALAVLPNGSNSTTDMSICAAFHFKSLPEEKFKAMI